MKAVVLFSGGIDSTVLLWWAQKKYKQVATLSVFFPGRRKSEIKSMHTIRKISRLSSHYDVTLPFVNIPRAEKGCYIPQKNLMYYSMGASLAEKIGATVVCGGHTFSDSNVFKDATPKYFKQLEKTINLGSFARDTKAKNTKVDKTKSVSTRQLHQLDLTYDAYEIKLLFPFLRWSKKKIIDLGLKLHAPLDLTWSCSFDVKTPCGQCPSCQERLLGFGQ